ncbi:MAG TPA: arginine deiminase-related protein [Chitinophagaceae bacterium]|nr:amidinotransferase [Chitinophagaceae bacterium]MCC6634415.1 amidinotransferase [Chitinophagaceae bacterium]HMZ45586.1 arginine deiminase-related protein [Chitinophagaceae bacterium]HNE93097.1 arginine deiminase-related protein [Chitinophagaceae bacterium]HNF29200.1 arginine deiminase-related protein [Chitinophagaceae bacterium]
MQTTQHLLMIKPVHFTYNAQTAVNNAFQNAAADSNTQQNALNEFNNFVELLMQNGIDVTVIEDTLQPHTPDSIFPNNWISFHANGTILLYPMYAENRRQERKPHVLENISKKFSISTTIDLTNYEKSNLFLEGTGSMVLDREKNIAYACISPRTDATILEEFCNKMHFTPMLFKANDSNNSPIYHTNVMMCVADKYVVICLDAITDHQERSTVIHSIESSGKQIVPITLQQMNKFAGNMLQVNNQKGEKFLIMSSQAYQALTPQQINQLQSYNHILHSNLTTIETNGGGSARCMMAEVFLPLK